MQTSPAPPAGEPASAATEEVFHMNVGKPRRVYRVEPVRVPVPDKEPTPSPAPAKTAAARDVAAR